mmetsp:Transcript_1434/g.3692  ORF Transcript_1434/g.3692 Transcript_1434/m.3692 type:complete len:249 (-) Transcript_1434:370-1116(-)
MGVVLVPRACPVDGSHVGRNVEAALWGRALRALRYIVLDVTAKPGPTALIAHALSHIAARSRVQSPIASWQVLAEGQRELEHVGRNRAISHVLLGCVGEKVAMLAAPVAPRVMGKRAAAVLLRDECIGALEAWTRETAVDGARCQIELALGRARALKPRRRSLPCTRPVLTQQRLLVDQVQEHDCALRRMDDVAVRLGECVRVVAELSAGGASKLREAGAMGLVRAHAQELVGWRLLATTPKWVKVRL